jgi:CubicO group peptidase (beta-lactamase class C family)
MAIVQLEGHEVTTSHAFEPVKNLLAEGAREGVYPGAVLYVGRHGKLIYRGAVGSKSLKTEKNPDGGPMTVDTVFDVASLTAGVITTTILMRLVEQGRLRLEDRVSRYIQAFGVLGKSPITVAHLLTHTSGLISWHPYFEELLRENEGARMGIITSRSAREWVLNAIVRSSLKGEVGGKHVYSDTGLMLLGFLIEAVAGLPLLKAAYQYVIQPMRLKSTSFIDLSRIKRGGLHPVTDMLAPTEECPWRQRMLWGEVHDDNAWAMGGIAGHSGLFSSGSDLHQFAKEMVNALDGRSHLLKRSTLDLFLTGHPVSGSVPTIKLGWDSPTKENGMTESGLSSQAFGYNGFTGCSLWIDPSTGCDIILMTNRIHPSRSNKKILSFRPQLYRAVHDALERL